MDPATRVRELIEPALVSAGFELVDVEASSHLVRVTVDRAGGGIDLDAVSAASRLVSGLLDAHDPVRGDACGRRSTSAGSSAPPWPCGARRASAGSAGPRASSSRPTPAGSWWPRR